MAGLKGKKEWTNADGKPGSLEDAINRCIVRANKGKVIDSRSQDMKDLVAYIKSLAVKTKTMQDK
jgi:cytochrome c